MQGKLLEIEERSTSYESRFTKRVNEAEQRRKRSK